MGGGAMPPIGGGAICGGMPIGGGTPPIGGTPMGGAPMGGAYIALFWRAVRRERYDSYVPRRPSRSENIIALAACNTLANSQHPARGTF